MDSQPAGGCSPLSLALGNSKDKAMLLEDKNIRIVSFRDISIDDPFFYSLKEDYKEFPEWFKKKSDERAYVIEGDDGSIQAFLYLKEEFGKIDDVNPPLPQDNYLKIGTFKINAHGTKLGERFIKKAFDYAISQNIRKIYVTIFPKHEWLISLLIRFGFVEYGEKVTRNGREIVLLKDFDHFTGNIELDYPIVNLNKRQYLLSIYPDYHTKLFPDSKLMNEDFNIIDDVSHTNSISKIYICKMRGVESLRYGDLLVIYRTSDQQGPAWYRSVATSFCMVKEIKTKYDFSDLEDFLAYSFSRSVFSEEELIHFYKTWNQLIVINFTYNIAFPKRIIRKTLIEDIGISQDDYWGFLSLTKDQVLHIAELGGVNESLIVY